MFQRDNWNLAMEVTPRKDKQMAELVNKIIAYENDQLSDDEVIALFQELVDNGMAWTLQGHYGRMAQNLIDLGLVTANANTDTDKS